ncbi:DUF6792 domain-containing protein [Bacillus subtilis]|uniref:DUF6792 domain-containing protein n=1 Tax=Bacillus subtilis TaxID=1423 RepID=UPI000B4BA848|nr:DUF6792 domain-containing protein [Bacillus subtilis]ASB71622.1 Putative uncharacterized protein YvcB [Bacillus subtilis subsp. subtilis]AYK58640.1 hypothetical protein D9C10_16600 [Bacillus subtilis subsp. subtilis]MEC0292552.1 hypothetical protein [Bacillus subtilis]MEC0334394.1 hypothetical protein [Bacillus subtilis]MEC0367427.1 hypothetical protein [Bacillus subtilis]
MANYNIFSNENVKLRLINLEYDYKKKFASNNPKEIKEAKAEFEAEVRRIYKEETNQNLPKDIEIYTSKELIKKNNQKDKSIKESGYDGTAIYIKDSENQIDQLHIISEGSADNEDWSYNFFGLFLGIDNSQYRATREFTKEAKKRAGNSDELHTYALGHSLANNNQVMVQLIDGEFDEVYGVNGAQVSVNHLLQADKDLLDAMINKFNVLNTDELENVRKEDLKKAITQYYNDKGVTAKITQRISKDDPLYGVSGKADFITFGNVKMKDTNTDVKGIRSIIDKIPDEEVRSIQTFLRKYSDEYKKGGLNGFVMASTGIDAELVGSIFSADGNVAKGKIVKDRFGDIQVMVKNIGEKMPAFIKFFHTILNNSGTVVDQLEENGYIDETQRKSIKKQLKIVNSKIGDIEIQYQQLKYALSTNNVVAIVYYVCELIGSVNELKDAFETLDTETKDALKLIVDGHSIVQMLNALSKEKGFSYKGSDIYFTGKSGSGETIQVNLSSAVRIYQNGMKIVEDMEDAISKYQKVYSQEIDEDFIDKKQAIITAIHHMEENPSHYAFDLQFRLAAGFSHTFDKLEKISVHESFHTGALPANDGIVAELKKQTTEKRDFIKNIRESIEKLFEKEEMISQLFDFQP